MRKFISFLLISATLFSCVSSEKLLTNGQYDEAIEAASHKVKKGGKDADEQALILEDAFKKAQQKDKDQIDFLKKEDKPANWDDIYYIYVRMNNRQEKIKPLLPIDIKSKGRKADIQVVDYSGDIISSKQKAVEYFYGHAMQLLDKNTRIDARSAFGDLQTVKQLDADYKDINDQLTRSVALGTTFILYKIDNKSNKSLPTVFEEEMQKLPFAELNKQWLQYDAKAITNRKYDYTVCVTLKNIEVGPDAVTQNDYVESQQIADGFNYVLDDKGNVKKDVSGNDMKTPKYKTISCKIVESHQKKKAMINGTLDYTNNSTNQLVKSEPLMAETIFENNSATATGDVTALKPETKAKLSSAMVPFPNGFDMIMKATAPLKLTTKDLIWKNKDLLN